MEGEPTGEVEADLVRPAGLAYDRARRRLHVVDAGAHAVLTFEATAGGGLRLLRTIGRRGTVAGDFNFPTHAAVDAEGRLYVVDSMNHRVQIFGPEGKALGGFGRAGDGTGDFSKAKAVALDATGHVYVTDSLYDVVQVFDRDGRFLLVFGGSGHGAGLLWLPTGIYIDGEDRIFVSDSGNARVQVYRYVQPSTR
jgi:DNA-binding beta-propeller fold protein YncE